MIETTTGLARPFAAVPLRHLRWPEERLMQLRSMGLRTVGDLLRLPRGAGVRRLGREWLDELDRALGRSADVRRGFRTPERFDARCTLEHEIRAADRLEHACEPLLVQLQEFLRQRQAALAVLWVEFRHRAEPPTRLRLGLAAPSGDVERVRELLVERLAALPLPAPAIAIRLRSGALFERVQLNDGFRAFGSQALLANEALPRLIERLRARLGSDAVFGVSTVEDHRPERAWKTGAVGGQGKEGREKRKAGVKRPLWLLDEPLHFSAPFSLLSGPERIETGWWDGRDVRRDYFVARDAQGVRLWLYREPGRRGTPASWHLHGLFG